MDETADRHRRLALNEARFREINEGLERQVRAVGDDGGRVDFVCECTRLDCRDVIRLALDEYERVRGDGARFAVAGGHVDAEIERVVDDRGAYVVIEKIGAGRDTAESTDPRT